jgi:hypothetical protein
LIVPFPARISRQEILQRSVLKRFLGCNIKAQKATALKSFDKLRTIQKNGDIAVPF